MNATHVADAPALTDRPPLWLGAAELRRLLPPEDVIAALEAALAAAGPRAASGHAALACDVERGVFHVKATTLLGPRAVFVAKLNANFPGNPERGLPTIQGVAALCDADDGRLLALLDSPELTALRTGAATAVAARRLARGDSRRLLVCGAGRQAFAQVAALAAVLGLEQVEVCDLDQERAAHLARRIAAELDPALVGATRCFVDSPEQALASGELHHAVAAGALRAEEIAGRLDQLVDGSVAGRRTPEEITLFDSTGIAIEDAAAALAAYEGWCRSRAPGDL